MDPVTSSDLRLLNQTSPGPRVSLYLPTHPQGPEAPQDEIVLRHLLDEAEDGLIAHGMRPVTARQWLAPARQLPQDDLFWRERSQSLAVFVTEGLFRAYRLPDPVESLVVVNRRFQIRPLVALMAGNCRYLVLALSLNQVQLFEGTRFDFHVRDVLGLPGKMREALDYTSVDRGSQVHSAATVGKRKQRAVFHGQGGVRETRKNDIAAYLRQVEHALARHLRDEHAPLLLAGVASLVAQYREVATYPHIEDREIPGNVETWSHHELHRQAWEVMAPRTERAQVEAASRFRQLAGSPRVSRDVCGVLRAVLQGRVDSLFVDKRAHQWGLVLPGSGEIETHTEFHPGDEDLLDLAALQTLAHRGRVFALPRDQMPGEEPIAAVLRF